MAISRSCRSNCQFDLLLRYNKLQTGVKLSEGSLLITPSFTSGRCRILRMTEKDETNPAFGGVLVVPLSG